jgi:hypothetical protein
MLTVELVDELIERFKGWSTDGPHGVLRYLDQAQSILMAQESPQNLAYDEETGKLPTLTTEQGKLVYDLPDNIWRCSDVMTYNGTGGLSGKTVDINNVSFWSVRLLRTRDWLSHEQPATVTFAADPGLRTFVLRAYRRPIDLTSTKIAHVVPPPNDVLYLLPAAAQLIEGVQNGTTFEARHYIETAMKPKFWAQMHKGQQSTNTEPVDRGF